jgi:glucose-1-phosphate thymidylyltransferase
MQKKSLGIILAAGKSSRLYPATFAATKQVLPIYDKPLIYYPLSTLMLAGIRDFVIITTPEEAHVFKNLLWDSKDSMGIRVRYAVQPEPRGIADAFNVISDAYDDISGEFDRFALVLGDNIFYGAGLTEVIKQAMNCDTASCLVQKVEDPERFGVINLGENGEVLDIEEKPKQPKSDLAITGMYFFNRDVFKRVRKLKPSARGELEITDILNEYAKDNELKVIKLLRGIMWFDTGTPDSLLEAATMIRGIQKHHGYMVASPHEIAYNNGWIDNYDLMTIAKLCEKSAYGKYLSEMLD